MGTGTRDPLFNAYPQTTDQGRLWFPCRNVGSEIIPPYSIVQLTQASVGDDPEGYVLENVEGQACWLVKQCDDAGEASENPAKFAVTGPEAIFVGGRDCFGRCTFQWPAQVRHDGNTDLLQNGQACGPTAGKWEVRSDGSGFVNLGHDLTKAFDSKGVHTVWVAVSYRPAEVYGRFITDSSTVPAGGTLSLGLADSATGEPLGSTDNLRWLGNRGFGSSTSGAGGSTVGDGTYTVSGVSRSGIVIPVRGLYDFDLSGTIWSTDVDNPGTRLSLSIEIFRYATSAVSVAQIYEAVRYHDVERDYEQAIKVAVPENVAVSGFLALAKNDIVAVKNNSSVVLSLEAVYLTMRYVADKRKYTTLNYE